MNNSISFTFALLMSIIVAAVFLFLLFIIFKQKLQLVSAGLRDEQLIKEYEQKNSKAHKVTNIVSLVLSILVGVFFLGCFSVSLYSQVFNNNAPISGVNSVYVVNSGSMSFKHDKNIYLKENDLDDQFDMYDLIVVKQLPEEEDLELYDIVIYEYEGNLVVHRIVGIEEPNEKHPEERYFLLKGDANKDYDVYPVTYDQMRSLYTGKRVPFIGVFVAFFQSPIGYIALLIILVYCILVPIAEGKIEVKKYHRLREINHISKEEYQSFLDKKRIHNKEEEL